MVIFAAGCAQGLAPTRPEPNVPSTVRESKPPPVGGDVTDLYALYGGVETDLVYRTIDGVDLTLDVYRPKGAPPPGSTPNPQQVAPVVRVAPTMVWVHGGGYFRGSKGRDVLRFLPWLAKGWNVVSIRYRLRQTALAPAAAEDSRCALGWVAANAATYGFDLDRLVVAGQSAGGHLALLAGMAPPGGNLDRTCAHAPPKVAAIVSWFGFVDLTKLVDGPERNAYVVDWFGPGRANVQDLAAQVSPAALLRPDLPAVVSVHGDADRTHPFAHVEAMHERLKQLGVPSLIHRVPGATSGDFSVADNRAANEAVFRFLAQRGLRGVEGPTTP